MSSELARGWLRIAVFFLLASGGLLFFQTPGTAEFVITVTSFVIGLIFTLIVVVIIRRSQH